jgi:hypothetical protein
MKRRVDTLFEDHFSALNPLTDERTGTRYRVTCVDGDGVELEEVYEPYGTAMATWSALEQHFTTGEDES